MITIRKFVSSDCPQTVDLLNEVLPPNNPWNDHTRTLQRKRQLDDLIFVAEEDASIVGVVIAGYDGVRGWLYSLAVAPAFRNQGIGQQLVEHAEAELCSLGCPKVNLQVRASNSEVVSFYQRRGYQAEDRISFGKTLHQPLPRALKINTSELSLRHADPGDLAPLVAMNQQLIADEHSENQMTSEQLSARMIDWIDAAVWTVMVVVHEQRLIGYSVSKRRPDQYAPGSTETYLRQFYVDSDYRRQGVGTWLFQQLRQNLFADTNRIVLDVLILNPSGLRFWQSVGFESHFVTMRLSQSPC